MNISSARHRKGLFILFLLIIILIILLLAPFVSGLCFKHYYSNLLAIMSKDSRVELKITEYHLGWLSSDVKILVTAKKINLAQLFSNPNLPTNYQPADGLIIDQQISHGPLVYDSANMKWSIGEALIVSHMHLPDIIETLLYPDDKAAGMMRIQTLVTYSHELYNTYDTPVYTYIQPNVVKFSWQGLKGTTYLDTSDQHIHHVMSNVNFGALSIEGGGNSIIVDPFSYQDDVVRNVIGVWTGKVTSNFSNVMMTTSGGNFGIKNYLMTGVATLQGNFYSVGLNINWKELDIPDWTVGPFNFAFNINNLNAAQFAVWLKEFYAMNLSSMPPAEQEQYVVNMLQPTTTLTGDLTFNTTNGNFQGKSMVSFSNMRSQADLPNLVKNAGLHVYIKISSTLVDKIMAMVADAQAQKLAQQQSAANQTPLHTVNSISLQPATTTPSSSDLLQQMHAQFDALVAQGLIIKDNNDYVVELSKEGDVIKVNGKVMPGKRDELKNQISNGLQGNTAGQ